MSKERIIKFEAYIPDLGIILEDITVYDNGTIGICSDDFEKTIKGKFKIYDDEICDISEDRNHVMNILCGDEWYWIEEGHFILRQYTGRNDTNSKFIYERDILKLDLKDGSHLLMLVRYVPDKCAFCLCNVKELKFEKTWDIYSAMTKKYFNDFKFEIIGNELQNPELLITE